MGGLARGVLRVSVFDVEATNYCDGNGLEEKSLWFWGRKSGALGKFCLTCALEFPILLPGAIITPHPLYQALGATSKERQSAYRALFRTQLDGEAINDIRLALNQSQPLGNERFYQHIEQMTGQRLEGKPRGRPRVAKVDGDAAEYIPIPK